MTVNKLESLRNLLQKYKVAATIIPSTDPHQSEYIADHWKSRAWLTGFNGSAGIAVVTKNHAGLWTDSRYFIQAEKQLNPPFILHRQKTKNPEYIDWLLEHLNFADQVGIDGRLFSAELIEYFKQVLGQKQIKIKDIGDVFQDLWDDRPLLTINPVFAHAHEFAGKTRTEKLKEIKTYLKAREISHALITALDDIAWLLNIRGNDINFNPVVAAYCLISHNQTLLFINEQKLNGEISLELKQDKITVCPYADIEVHIQQIKAYTSILLDKNSTSYHLIQSIPAQCKIITEPSIVGKYKATKNKVEIKNYKKAQIRDGIAMCNFLHWLDSNKDSGEMTEISAAEMAEKFRSVKKNYVGLSFETISAYGPNAALPHYSVTPESNRKLKPKGMYLVDSGAQYLDGTTDITRTVALGPVSEKEIEDFTLVLKGHIKLATAVFPYGTKGYQLDTLAREFLWKKKKDYGHGTGHGIGFFLNVHEGPQGFAIAANGPGGKIMEPGMLTTNEPGFYLENHYGIRIENVLLCVEKDENEQGKFLGFETVTYCPIDRRLINTSLLTPDEKIWIDQYHQQVFDLLNPMACESIKDWLEEQTKPLE